MWRVFTLTPIIRYELGVVAQMHVQFYIRMIKSRLVNISGKGTPMSIRAIIFAMLLVITANLAASDKDKVEQLQLQKVTYVNNVAPIMQKHCAECHAAGQQGAEATGFLVDSYESLMKGSRFGPVIDPGSAKTSSLYNIVSGKGNLAITMPHSKDPISAEEIKTIRVWIESGATEN